MKRQSFIFFRSFSDSSKEEMFSIFKNIFQCNIDRLPSEVSKPPFIKSSPKLKEYTACVHGKKQTASDCVTKAIQACNTSPIRVIKTVRMRLDLVLEFINLFPDVQIVFHLRDPRGILNSRWESCKNRMKLNYVADTNIVCKQMNYDANFD